jgi:hypothetical protein
MTARTIDDVVRALDGIIQDGLTKGSRTAYFPALYRRVTLEVVHWIELRKFEDPARMERLDVAFANRYLDAYAAAAHGLPVSRSWRVAFDAADSWWPVVLQHLLLGMNAHINLDLGIAAARACPGKEIETLHDDFIRINAVLSALIEDTRLRLSRVWPRLSMLERFRGTDGALVDFSMTRARDCAWNVARRLAPLDRTAQETEIALLDAEVAVLGRHVWRPGFGSLRLALAWVRLEEPRTPAEVIEIMIGQT